jgi:hypothetical protein
MSSSEQEPECNFPDVPEGPLSVMDDCWMVGRRNPDSMLQCNTYIRTFRQFGGQRNVCIDPGSCLDFEFVKSNIEQLVGSLHDVHGMTINHQDPDVAGNAPWFCDSNPEIELIVSEDVWRLLQHMMLSPGKLRLTAGRTRSISSRSRFSLSRHRFATSAVRWLCMTPSSVSSTVATCLVVSTVLGRCICWRQKTTGRGLLSFIRSTCRLGKSCDTLYVKS